MDEARILIVEDERIVARDLAGTLEKLGYTVCGIAASGEDAVARATGDRPDLVLMDIVLAGEMNGVDAAMAIRHRLDIPVVYLTAYADDATLQKAKVTEPFGYLIKPFEERELHTAIEMALYKHGMERKLRLNERWLSTTLRSIGDAVIATDARGRVKFMNTVAEDLTGWQMDEATGRDLTEVFDIVNEETRAPTENPVARALRDGVVVGLANHTILISRDGTEAPIADSAAPIRDDGDGVSGVVMVFRDISEERKAQRALAAEKEKLAVTLRSIGDGVIVTDTEGAVVSQNKVAEALTGWPEREAVGRPLGDVFQIIDERTREPAEDPVAKVLQAGLVVGMANHTALIARDGTERSIADSGAPIRDEESRILGVVLVFRDVSEARRLEEEVQRVQKLESVGILAGGIAHDFNNILTAIVGNISYAKILLPEGNEVRERLDEAEKASWRAKDLTQQLLTFSRGGAPVTRPADLRGMVKDSVAFALRGTNVRGAISAADDLWSVTVDPGQMNQVFNNLLINASQAMPEGGTAGVTLENVTLTADRTSLLPAGRYVRTSVRDEGVGISGEHLRKIFDPYFTTKHRGSGLGLAVSFSIVKSHGGAITVESELGRGSTFLVYLPATGEPLPGPAGDAETVVRGRGRVLVMDDEEQIRRLVGGLLSKLGYEVVAAQDGVEAIELYREARDAGEPIDVVILDLTVPGKMGGLETLERLRAIDPHVKGIVSSGYSNDPVIAEHERHGFRAAVIKPYNVEEFSRVVREVIAGTG